MKQFNERLAVFGTKTFGSMWSFYLFFIWGLLGMIPWFPPKLQSMVLLVSSAWIQLWALPLLAVGNMVLNKSSEKRAKQDHESLRVQLKEIMDLQKDNDEIKMKLDYIITQLGEK